MVEKTNACRKRMKGRMEKEGEKEKAHNKKHHPLEEISGGKQRGKAGILLGVGSQGLPSPNSMHLASFAPVQPSQP